MSLETGETPADGAFTGYAPPEQRPSFTSHAAFAALFNGSLAAGVLAARRAGHELPDRLDERDLLIAGVATFKLSRMLAKEKVTVFLRAPFTEFEAKGGPGEVEERPRGTGLRRTVGELLTCPYCLGMWTSAGFHLGLLTAPRATRFAASILAGVAIADFLQLAYRAAERSH
jgi:hypothetical protein